MLMLTVPLKVEILFYSATNRAYYLNKNGKKLLETLIKQMQPNLYHHINGSQTKGRITKGRITKGRMTKGRMTKGRMTKGRINKR